MKTFKISVVRNYLLSSVKKKIKLEDSDTSFKLKLHDDIYIPQNYYK